MSTQWNGTTRSENCLKMQAVPQFSPLSKKFFSWGKCDLSGGIFGQLAKNCEDPAFIGPSFCSKCFGWQDETLNHNKTFHVRSRRNIRHNVHTTRDNHFHLIKNLPPFLIQYFKNTFHWCFQSQWVKKKCQKYSKKYIKNEVWDSSIWESTKKKYRFQFFKIFCNTILPVTTAYNKWLTT